MSFPAIPAFERFPHTVAVVRDAENGTQTTIIGALECRIYRPREDLKNMGFGHVAEGNYRLACSWPDAFSGVDATSIAENDEVQHTPSVDGGVGKTQIFRVDAVQDPATLNYNAEIDLSLIAVRDA